jgi:hypothetical protein
MAELPRLPLIVSSEDRIELSAGNRSINIHGPVPNPDDLFMPWLFRGRTISVTLHDAEVRSSTPAAFCCFISPLCEGSLLRVVERALGFVLGKDKVNLFCVISHREVAF